MTKKDLKNGMVVEVRNGTRYLVNNDTLVGEKTYLDLRDRDDFTSKYDAQFDIVKIFGRTSPHCYFAESLNSAFNLLWEEKKFYNGKVVCTVNEAGFTRGKIYTFVNGFLTDDDGERRPAWGHGVTDLSQYNPEWFIEVVE